MSEAGGNKANEGLVRIVREQPFLKDLDDSEVRLLSGCARNVRFDTGAYLLREGEPANEFYLIRGGQVALEITAPGQDRHTFQSIQVGEVAGVSWLIPPYRWTYDGRATEPVRAIGMDAECLRNKCNTDPAFGYRMMVLFVPMLVQRLQATRMQLLDLYGRDG